jgi:hypothetical protein
MAWRTPTRLDLVEEPFDQIARPIQIKAEAKSICSIAFRRDVRPK